MENGEHSAEYLKEKKKCDIEDGVQKTLFKEEEGYNEFNKQKTREN